MIHTPEAVKLPRSFVQLDYMDWIKRHAQRPDETLEWGLALSGMPDADMKLLKPLTEDLPLFGNNHNGWRPWKEALAEKYSLKYEQVSTSFGTQMANFLAVAALAGPGDRVMVEYPTYEPLHGLPRGFASKVDYLIMKRENGWKVTVEEFKKAVGNAVRLVILANSHNPTGIFYKDDEIVQFAKIVADAGGHLLIDEVYRDAVPELRGRTTATLANNIVVTSSWTKVYGLSTLRAGWIFGSPEVIHAVELVNDRLPARGPLILEELCSRVARTPGLLHKCGPDRLIRLVGNRQVLAETAARNGWDVVLPDWSLVVYLKHPTLSGDEVSARGRSAGLLITPGKYFGDSSRIRMALTADTDTFSQLLRKLEEALQ